MKAQNTRAVLASLFLILIPLSAQAETVQGGCDTAELFAKLAQQSDVLVTDGAQEVDESLLFYQAPFALETGDVLAFEVSREGKNLLSEEIRLIEDETSLGGLAEKASREQPVIELLSTQPALRSKLRELVEAGGEVEAKLSVNGGLVTAIDLAGLVGQSADLANGEAMPRAISSELLSHAGHQGNLAAPPLKLTCEERCEVSRIRCYFGCSSSACENACDNAYNTCVDACGSCGGTVTTTTVTLVSTTALPNQECKYDDFLNRLGFFRLIERRYKRTVTTTTYHPNCSTTTSTSVSYINTRCWSYLFQLNCFPGFPDGLGFC